MNLKSAALALSLSLSVLVLSPNHALADTLTLTGVGGQNTDGVYVYPYLFTYTGPGGTVNNLAMSCLSFDREIYLNESWTVQAVLVSGISSAGLDGESQASYIEDAFLFNKYAGASALQISELQFAIWNIMDPAVQALGLSGYDAGAKAYDDQAAAAYASGNYSFDAKDMVFVPVAGGFPVSDGEPQIFMIDPPPLASTPEPSSLMLLGTGLFATVGMMRRKLQTVKA